MALPSFHSFEQTYILFTRIYSQQVTEQTSKSKKVKPITDLDTSTLTSPLDRSSKTGIELVPSCNSLAMKPHKEIRIIIRNKIRNKNKIGIWNGTIPSA